MYEGENDPYIDESTGILKNLMGITNAQNLESAECNIAYARSSDLYQVERTQNFLARDASGTKYRCIHSGL